MWELNPFSVQWDQKGISTRAAPKRCSSGFWTELKWLNFNWNHWIPCQNKHWSKKKKKVLSQTSRWGCQQGKAETLYEVMFTILTSNFGVIWSHFSAFKPGSDTTPKPNKTPKSDTTSVAPDTPQPGWALLAPKGGEKKNPVKFKKYLQSCLLLISWLQAERK